MYMNFSLGQILAAHENNELFYCPLFSKTDPETIPKVLHNMMMMLQDKSVTVQKKAIQVTAKLYKLTLMWLCRSKSVSEDMEVSWNSVCDLKKYIIKLIDSDLDGYATSFMNLATFSTHNVRRYPGMLHFFLHSESGLSL